MKKYYSQSADQEDLILEIAHDRAYQGDLDL